LGGRGRQISEFEASLVYRVSSRTARGLNRETMSQKKKKKKKDSDEILVYQIKGNLRDIELEEVSPFLFLSQDSHLTESLCSLCREFSCLKRPFMTSS
jgi:hypothetical protein